ncbi:helix-turn-helix domain-containing protein [Streptomyces sp. NPDC059766]|uniref:helix-turn-helix domain-containing protein n=1 Tax=Streptomyces sp. NPDC059766 TaxID=3346940 RepID=UPI003665D132
MTSSEDEDRRRAEKARQVGLFRYSLIQDLLDSTLTDRERGRLARELTEKEHADPFGRQVKVSRGTIDRWTRAYRGGGFAALVPEPRKAVPRTPPEALELAAAAALKREDPGRTAAQTQRILRTTQGWSPTERTLQRHFVAAGLTGTSGDKSVFGRFEATSGNELWTGDALHGPKIGGRKTSLFACIDDHSRAIGGTGLGSRRTPSASPPSCGRPCPPAVSRSRSTSTTGPRSWTRGCCGPALGRRSG